MSASTDSVTGPPEVGGDAVGAKHEGDTVGVKHEGDAVGARHGCAAAVAVGGMER